MKAIILAAGEGSRLREVSSVPKPLFVFMGKPLIERTIRTLKDAGIRNFYVVVGHRAPEVESFVKKLEKEIDAEISIVQNPDFKKGNGSSAYHGLLKAGEEAILTMSDHLFSVNAIRHFCEKVKETEKAVVLGVTFNLKEVHDLDEATKVVASKGEVKAIGKELQKFNGVDCGIFYFRKGAMDYFREGMTNETFTLTDAVKNAAQKGDVQYIDLSQFGFLDIDDPGSFSAGEKFLIKTNLDFRKDGVVSRYLNRRISLPISLYILRRRIPLSPNAISAFSFIIMAVASLLGFFQKFALSGILAQIASIIDGVDGEVAKLSLSQSVKGAFLDSFLDRASDALLIAGLSTGYYLASKDLSIFLWAMLCLFSFPLSMAVKDRYKAITGKEFLVTEEGWLSYLPANRDGRIFILFVFSLLGLVKAGLMLTGLLSMVLFLFRFYRILSKELSN